MSELEDLERFRSYAVAVRDCADGLDVPGDFAEVAARLAQAASDLLAEADQPLRIGVVGEFSSGKSLLLGVLLGNPCLLSTSTQPTTGNVTELRFSAGREEPAGSDSAEPAQTTIDRAEISFFTSDDIGELDWRMVEGLGAAAERSHSGTLQSLRDADSRGPAALKDWCSRAWLSADPATRKLTRELLQTRAAVEQSAHLLGASQSVDRGHLPKLLQIPYPESAASFADILAPYTGAGSGGADDYFVRVFPIIERVILHLRVPAKTWELTGQRDRGDFVLIDFPGAGGGLTQVRDLFLTHRGLRDVHTVLVMVDAGKPGGQVADTFYGFLRKLTADQAAESGPGDPEPLASRLLYCATRFDLMRPPTEAEVRAVVDGADLTEQALLGTTDPLRALLQSGHRPGAAAMAAMLSSVTAIAAGGLTPAPAELDLAAHTGTAMSRARRWREIADELRPEGAGRELAEELRQYAEDGGVARLRWLLERHVAQHGLAQRVSRLRELAVGVEKIKAELMEHLTFHAAAARSAPDDQAARARKLLNEVNRFLSQYQRRTLPQLKDPSMISLPTGRSLQDDVTQQAAELVIEWPQWAEILACVRDAIVVPPKPVDDRPKKYDLGLIPASRSQRTLPQTADDFSQVYSETCDRLTRYARDRALEGLKRWLEIRSREVAELRQQASSMLSSEVRRRLAGGSLPDVADTIDALLAPHSFFDPLADLIERERPIRAAAPAGGRAGEPAGPAQPGSQPGFPLRPGQAMPWSADWGGDEATRHVVRMLRIRTAFITSVTEQALAELEALQGLIYAALSANLESVQLPQADEQADFLAAATGRARERGPQGPPEFVAILESIMPPAPDEYR